MAGPLEGYRIIDLTQMISGPFATMMLADQGADVIKVETGVGDLMRYAGPMRGGLAAPFITSNRNKRSVLLNLKTEEGKEVLRRLIEGADVLIQNFRPGAMARIGFDEPTVRTIKPDIVFTSISGFGNDGPFAHQRVYDPVIQALSGLMDVQGGGGEPCFVSTIVPDKNTALSVTQGVTAALLHRERTGEGQHVQIAMLDALVAWLWPDGMMNHTFVGEGATASVPLSAAYSDPMPTKDGIMVAAALSDVEWRGFCNASERQDLLENPDYKTLSDRAAHVEELLDVIRDITSTRTTAEWLERLNAHDVPCAPVNRLEDIFDDPQLIANETIVEREHPAAGKFREPRPAIRFDKTPAEVRRPAPMLGEHTHDVLAEVGFSDEEIGAFERAGAFA